MWLLKRESDACFFYIQCIHWNWKTKRTKWVPVLFRLNPVFKLFCRLCVFPANWSKGDLNCPTITQNSQHPGSHPPPLTSREAGRPGAGLNTAFIQWPNRSMIPERDTASLGDGSNPEDNFHIFRDVTINGTLSLSCSERPNNKIKMKMMPPLLDRY